MRAVRGREDSAIESKTVGQHGRHHCACLYVAASPGPRNVRLALPSTESACQGPRAEAALAAVAFAESSFFPIPPDVLLAPMALAKPERAWRYALIATVASVVGGMLGYAIGALLFDTLGEWLVNLYGYGAKMDALKQTYAQWGWPVILVKGLTPIPYKLVTIVSGVLGYNFPLFVALSILTRGARLHRLPAWTGSANRCAWRWSAISPRFSGDSRR